MKVVVEVMSACAGECAWANVCGHQGVTCVILCLAVRAPIFASSRLGGDIIDSIIETLQKPLRDHTPACVGRE